MNTLTIAMHCEGDSDAKVLPILVQRIVQQLVNDKGWASRGWNDTYVLQPEVLNEIVDSQHSTLAARLMAAARFSYGYHLLIIHRDADAKTTDKAKRKIAPALKRIEQAQAQGEQVCETQVLLVPIREMEAWLLVDADALCGTLGVSEEEDMTGLLKRTHDLEACDAKVRLNQVVAALSPGTDLDDIYERLAQAIRLDKLRILRAYQEFEKELTEGLVQLSVLAPKTTSG